MLKRKFASINKQFHSKEEEDYNPVEVQKENCSSSCSPVIGSLAMRRKRNNLKSLTISTNSKDELKPLNCFKLVSEMKQSYINGCFRAKSCRSIPDNSDLSYIFVKPVASNKNLKENQICEFLNNEGIFQINLGVAMKDYNISF